MKLIHISDLHLGKKVKEISMLEEQKNILDELVKIVLAENADGAVIAGDIYDKPVPPAEAVQLFDSFLVRLAEAKIPVFAISGNHDSAERIAFGSRLMTTSGIYLSQVYGGECPPIKLEDEFGTVNIYMLPFVRPSSVKRFFPDSEIESYDDAVRIAVKNMNVNPDERNVIIAHQFITGAERCESENISVGGVDNIGADIFAAFDYAALGHIHSPQSVSRPEVRYCGTPLKYSFSEVKHVKTVTIVELKEKGNVEISTLPVKPLHDMREIRGTYMEVAARDFYTEENRFDYLHITLTDEQDIPNAVGKLRTIYPNLMTLDYDNKRTRAADGIVSVQEIKSRSPLELFGEFYEKSNGAPMNEIQREYISDTISGLWQSEQ